MTQGDEIEAKIYSAIKNALYETVKVYEYDVFKEPPDFGKSQDIIDAKTTKYNGGECKRPPFHTKKMFEVGDEPHFRATNTFSHKTMRSRFVLEKRKKNWFLYILLKLLGDKPVKTNHVWVCKSSSNVGFIGMEFESARIERITNELKVESFYIFGEL